MFYIFHRLTVNQKNLGWGSHTTIKLYTVEDIPPKIFNLPLHKDHISFYKIKGKENKPMLVQESLPVLF